MEKAVVAITYNVRSFEGLVAEESERNKIGRKQIVERLALEFQLYQPDIICIQEAWSEGLVARLAAKLEMDYVYFHGGTKMKGWDEGISGALLTRYEVQCKAVFPMVSFAARPAHLFTRFWGSVIITTEFGPLAVYAAHLHPGDASVRIEEINEMLKVINRDQTENCSVLLMGDLNHEPDADEYALLSASGLTDSFARKGGGFHLTWPSINPEVHIDYIWSSGPVSDRLSDCRVLYEGCFRTYDEDPGAFALSDHLPVMAIFDD